MNQDSNRGPKALVYNKSPLRYHHAFYESWTGMIRFLLNFARVETSGLDALNSISGGILAPNHLNWKDPFFVSGVVRQPIRFVATYRLFDRPLCIQMFDEYAAQLTENPRWLRNLHSFNGRLAKFTVKRIRFSGALPSALKSCDYSLPASLKSLMSSRRLLCIFPEGRTSGEKLNRLKLGLSRFLFDHYAETQMDIPVLPVGITGTDKAISPGMRLGFHMGKPIYIKDFLSSKSSRCLVQFTSVLQQRINELMLK